MKSLNTLGGGRIWFAVTLIASCLSYMVFVKMLGKPAWWVLAFVGVYLLLSLLLFYDQLMGEISVYYNVLGQYDKARALAEKLATGRGKSVSALNLYAIMLLQEGKADEALGYFQKARQRNRNPIRDKYIAMSIGSCYWLKGDIPQGIAELEALVAKHDYLNPDVYTTLGFLYLLQKDYDKAEYYTNQALADNPNHAPAYDNLGQIAYGRGDTAQACKYFEKALALNPNMTDSKYYLGLIYEASGRATEAKELFLSAHGDYVTALNTVTKQQIDEKYQQYAG